MPLSQSELAELSAYVNSPAGASDNEAREALAEEMRPARAGNAGLRQVQNAASDPTGFHSQASAPGPSTNAAANTGPSRKNLASPPQPNEQRATQPSFTDGKTFGGLPGEQASAGVTGPGASIGATALGTLGSFAGPGGRIAGSAVGGFMGNLSEQNIRAGNAGPGVQYDMSGSEPVPYYPGGTNATQNVQQPLDYNQAGAAGAAQGALNLGTMGLGIGAFKLGFPRIGAALSGITPQRGVSAVTPAAAKGVSTAALQSVDNAASPAGAVQQAASGAKQALEDLPIANEAARAQRNAALIQPRLATGARNLAPLNAKFAGAVKDALGVVNPNDIEAAVKAGTMTPQQALIALNEASAAASAPAGKDLATLAFRNPTAFPRTASSAEVAAAKIPLARAAAKQKALGMALNQTEGAQAAATARGLAHDAGPQLAADAQGLKSIANLGVKPASLATAGGAILGGAGGFAAGGPAGGGAGMAGGAGLAKILTKLLASGSDEAAAGIAPVAIRGGQRAQQTVSAMLANRGLQSANPLSDSAGYQLVNAPNALDAILAALSQNRSKK